MVSDSNFANVARRLYMCSGCLMQANDDDDHLWQSLYLLSPARADVFWEKTLLAWVASAKIELHTDLPQGSP